MTVILCERNKHFRRQIEVFSNVLKTELYTLDNHGFSEAEFYNSGAPHVGPYSLPPPCLYVLQATIPCPRNNPNPRLQRLSNVQLMPAFKDCFQCRSEEISYVSFDVAH